MDEITNRGAKALHNALVVAGYPIDNPPQHGIAVWQQARQWVVLMVSPGREDRIAEGLRRSLRGWSIYWPNYRKQVCNGRCGRRYVHSAVVPGYLFAGMPPLIEPGDDPWGVIHDMPSVHGCMRDLSDQPRVLREQEMREIEAMETTANLPQQSKRPHNFAVNNGVRFVDDTFERWPGGRVIELHDNGRLTVEVGLFGGFVPVVVWPHQLEKTASLTQC